MFEIAKIIFNAANEELLYEMIGSESYMAVLGMLECSCLLTQTILISGAGRPVTGTS